MTTPSKIANEIADLKAQEHFYSPMLMGIRIIQLESELAREKERSARLRESLKRAHARMIRVAYTETHFLNEIMKSVDL